MLNRHPNWYDHEGHGAPRSAFISWFLTLKRDKFSVVWTIWVIFEISNYRTQNYLFINLDSVFWSR